MGKFFFIFLFTICFLITDFTSFVVSVQANVLTTPTKLTDPLGVTDLNIVIGKIINSVLGVVGSIALAMFVYGGFRWMTSGGGDGVKEGKDTIVWATLGLIVIFTAYAVVKFILSNVLLSS